MVKYKVLKGDTLSSISKKYYGNANRYMDIARKNGITDVNSLSVGQELKIDESNNKNNNTINNTNNTNNSYKLAKGDSLSKVAQNNGTTGATEPVITTETDWDNLALDGTVLWKLRTTLYEAGDYETNFCTEKMVIIERNAEGCGGVNVFDRILEGVELTYYAVQKDDGVIVSTQNIPFMAIKERRSSEPGFEDITVTNVIKPREDYFTAENVLIRVDGQKYGTLLNFMLEYTRNVTMRTSTEPNERIVVVDKPTFTGSGTIKLDPVEYELLRKISTKSITISMNGYDGETVNITVPKTQFINPTINKEGSREFWMDFTLNPTGNLDNAMAKVDITTAINFN